MDVLALLIGAFVVAAVAFLAFGNLRPARTARLPERHKRTE